ncbi:glutathione S-transferase C-terminal domain-containing protein [Alkalimarinus coralli]|uniref:glutathione S-transferase C-terminal domain-containing protein n=1 Tax=Alkalimarinus coralli TaxID=2935863 RepID=UPI00202ACD39|nr:glutathione S-transferase C-terminal domain-containing protein [Alkalimarinus coralli]
MAILDNGIWYPDGDINQISKPDRFEFPNTPEAGRYHLYMSLACPFAHRPYLVINYLGLEHTVSVSTVASKRGSDGWVFDDEHPDTVNGTQGLVDLYLKSNPHYSGRVTVPVLWDKHKNVIVGDDSSFMAMALATKWLPLAKNPVELVPAHLAAEISTLNDWLHQQVNRKVYHVGFASEQDAYNIASDELFTALEQLNDRLGQSSYLHGDEITLSDLFLLPTLVRFEAVYALHFKANKRALCSLVHLYEYMLRLVRLPRIRETIDLGYMKLHYYFSHKQINPTGIVPAGPEIIW